MQWRFDAAVRLVRTLVLVLAALSEAACVGLRGGARWALTDSAPSGAYGGPVIQLPYLRPSDSHFPEPSWDGGYYGLDTAVMFARGGSSTFTTVAPFVGAELKDSPFLAGGMVGIEFGEGLNLTAGLCAASLLSWVYPMLCARASTAGWVGVEATAMTLFPGAMFIPMD